MTELIKSAAAQVGTELSDKQAEQLQKYYELLIEWNEKINLTRITEPEEVAVKHFADSLTLLKYFELKEGASVIDVGTGAGFPGIPLKIARPDIRLTLLDSLNKRINFLKEVCESIGIEAELVHSRAEDGGKNKSYREKFDVAVSRAVARLNVLSEYCLPYVRIGGSFVPMKGPEMQEEINEAKPAIKLLGGELRKVNAFTLENAGDRTIIEISKIKPTPKAYPRNSGKIKSSPIL